MTTAILHAPTEPTRSIFIETREWFDRSGGNTYFSTRIWVNGEIVGITPTTYGYDSSHIYVALEALRTGLFLDAITWRDELQPIRPRDLEHAGIDCYITANRVTAKRDMFKIIR